MASDYLEALRLIEKEKGIPFEELLRLIETTLAGVYKRSLDSDEATAEVRVSVHEKGVNVYSKKMVSVYVDKPHIQIKIDDAAKVAPDATIGDWIEVEVTPANFGRIVAQTAKQVIVQKIRETEKDNIFKEYQNLVNEVVTGVVNRKEGTNCIIDLGKVEGHLPLNEQVPSERYRTNDRMKFYVIDVVKNPKGSNIILSRTHPALIRRLFEFEVPEIEDEIVKIVAVARESGSRTKMSVSSNDPNVDAMGSCVGHRGLRVQAVVDELYGEKIDILEYSSEPREYVSRALAPAKPISVNINENDHAALAIVPANQLSLAIGKMGQNARLAAKLTGWKIDIKSEAALEIAQAAEAAEALEAAKITEIEEIAETTETVKAIEDENIN